VLLNKDKMQKKKDKCRVRTCPKKTGRARKFFCIEHNKIFGDIEKSFYIFLMKGFKKKI